MHVTDSIICGARSLGWGAIVPSVTALPLFKVIRPRLDSLCLQHEPGVFQDCLAHLEGHTSKGD
jgi:hypothetical protein